ncbi:hypothetical protein, partial [Pseudactinotalea sp.]|uniref:hypothetical protein n=1 Tax=Pseudactinotalea sp. TaxID=1926260 RepID=UPI003B3B59A0
TSPEPFSEQRIWGVKVRGRTYAINAIYERVGDEWKFVNPLYRGGYMNSDGRPLALESGVHATLRKLEHEVLAEYINQHPRWSAVSERKGLEVEIAEAYGEEILAREKIARLRNRLAMLRSRSTQLPTTC